VSTALFPDVAELLPHASPMRLLGRVIAHAPASTVCALDPAASELFRDADGRIPGWVALEWMAQCIAAHGGLVARASGRPPAPGMLVGARRLEIARSAFTPGDPLEVEARFAGAAGALASFECALREGAEVVATATLSVYVSDSFARAPRAGA